MQLQLFTLSQLGPHTPTAFNSYYSTLEKINELEETIFDQYITGEADKRYFKIRIYTYLIGKDKDTLHKTIFDATWHRNNQGHNCKYLSFNEYSQRLFLEVNFWQWCKMICIVMNEELGLHKQLLRNFHATAS